SVFVTLKEKGITFDTKPVSLAHREQLQPAYRHASITGRVPALDHEGFWLAESSAMVDYLEDVCPTPAVLPRDPRRKARARQILAWVRSDLLPIREERPTHTMFYERATAPLSAAGRVAARKLIDVCEQLIHPGKTTLFGDWCIADSDLAFMLHRLILNGDP